MPRNIGLEAQIDPDGTQLWTDGESHLFLRLKSKELLAPASRTGVFNIYGMCHELGHIAMFTIEAAHRRNDLIVMGASERGLLRSMISGNPLEEVLRETPCNLIILRPRHRHS